MIGWITDNELSHRVMEAIPGIEIQHINRFFPAHIQSGIFYGILRGSARAMHILQYHCRDFYYIDNGYFDALYVDRSMQKSMEGKFRVVKNGMHDICGVRGVPYRPKRTLIIPPSPYSANFYDTTPEDWLANPSEDVVGEYRIRNKSSKTLLEDDLEWCTGVLAFNSMAVMRAIQMGRAVADTHGCFRRGFAHYDLDEVRAFYEPRQFTLEEMKQGKIQWN